MHILVTNDDGIDSMGLHVLARSMTRFGRVTVVAPDTEYSGASAALGALLKIRPEVHRSSIEGVDEAWSVEGAPALCVTFARLGAFGRRIDLVVAGINPGANVGRSVYHSGTVGAALTARNGGITAVAVSQAVAEDDVEGQGADDSLEGQQWGSAAEVASTVVAALVESPPAKAEMINVNVPNLALGDIRGWRRTSVATTPNRAMAGASLEAKPGHPGTYRVRMTWGDKLDLPPETDGFAVEAGFVSITALGMIDEVAGGQTSEVGVALDTLFAS